MPEATPPDFPQLDDAFRLQRLAPPSGPVRMLLDTDTYNEIDDQFAVVYTLLAQEIFKIEGFAAAPYSNSRCPRADEGMENSYQEILRLLEFMDEDHPALRGSTAYMPAPYEPVESEGARFIVDRALAAPADDPLYVTAIGCITNVSSAILMEPRIIEKLVVVWLGGNIHSWTHARDYNMEQDLHASRLIFDCGVPLVQIPAMGVTSHLLTTLSQVRDCVRPHGDVGAYLAQIFEDYLGGDLKRAKEIWDIAALAYFLNHEWTPSMLVHTPHLSDDFRYAFNGTRPWMRYVYRLNRNAIFGDFFDRLEAHAD